MGVGCLALVVFLILLYVTQQAPWMWAVFAAIAVAAIFFSALSRRQNKIASIAAFNQQAQLLDSIANDIEASRSSQPASFALKDGEILLASQDNVKLLEWVSNGSSYQGGSSGFSFRVMRGVSYRVGQSRGQIVKNPPTLKTVDVGSVNFTTERITFVGPRETRAYDVAKILDLTLDHNGQTVMISVSNRQKPSALQGSSFDLIGPGFLVQAALNVHNSGAKAAADGLRQDANQLRAAAEDTRIKLKLKPETA